MRTLWNALATLAIAHLVALIGVLSWMGATGRLSMERLDEVRDVFAEPLDAERAKSAADEKAAAEAALKAKEEAKKGQPPVTAEQLLALRLQQQEVDRQRLERMRREVQDLSGTIQRRERALAEREEAQLEREKQFEAMRERLAAVEGNRQFRNALAVLEQLKPSQAKVILGQLIATGIDGVVVEETVEEGTVAAGTGAAGTRREDGMERAVAYLNALEERKRARVLDEFAKDDPALAADLLERIRTRGLVARDSGDSAG